MFFRYFQLTGISHFHDIWLFASQLEIAMLTFSPRVSRFLAAAKKARQENIYVNKTNPMVLFILDYCALTSYRTGYPHPVCPDLEESGNGLAVGDFLLCHRE